MDHGAAFCPYFSSRSWEMSRDRSAERDYGMDMFSSFAPEQLIRGISCVKTTGRELTRREIAVLKRKLRAAEENPAVIRLARGDGRPKILDQIVADDRVIFGWGLKSRHAFLERSPLRDFLEPNQMDAGQLKRILKLYEDDLPYHFRKAGFGAGWNSARHRSLVQRLYDSIDANQDTGENLLLIKDWLCAVLHTAGSPAFHNLSPWVSVSAGSKRYKTAYLFGAGKADSYRGERTRRRFVIFDTWVSPGDEHRTFERTQFLIARFREIGLPWYADRHYEIMLKYAIYPQNLIGYYYFENDMPLHYYLNPHYWSRMESDPHFQIGDEVMIDQTDVGFPADNPYRIIYERRGGRFGVYERR